MAKGTRIPPQGKIEPITIEGRGFSQKITMEGIAELHAEMDEEELMNGKPCVCVSCCFRAAQLAFSKLWHGDKEIPKRGDIKIISALPTRGSQITFKYILGLEVKPEGSSDGFVLEIPRGTDKKNLTQENYVFTFIRKSTNDSVLVRVRPEIFPTGYFDLGKIVEHGIPREATEEEKERHEVWEREVRDKFLTFFEEELFINET